MTLTATIPTKHIQDVERLRASFTTVANLVADTTLSYTEGDNLFRVDSGDVIAADAFSYQVAISTASDNNLTTAGGIKLYVLIGADGSYNVKAFGAVGDGVTDDSTAVQAAIDQAVADGMPGPVVFPHSDNFYLLTNIALDGSNLKIDASRAYLKNTSATSMFVFGATSDLQFSDLIFNRLVNTGTGHVFENKGLLAQCKIYAKRITNQTSDGSGSIFHSSDASGGSVFFCRFEGDYWYHHTTSTVSAIDISGATNVCSENYFGFTRADRTGSTYYFNLECTGAGQFFYNNHIETGFEVVNGGGIALFGCSNTRISNGNFYDMGTTTKDLILLSSSGSGNECRGTIIDNVARNSGTLGSSLYDINLNDAIDTIIINSGAHNTTPAVTYNLNSKSALIINPLNVTYVGQTSAQQIIENDHQALTVTTPSTLVIASDAITVKRSYHKVDTEASAATDDLSTINGGVDGMRLVLQSVANARDVTLKNGIGNMRLQGGTDFTLTRVSDTIELIYNGTQSEWNEVSRSDNQT